MPEEIMLTTDDNPFDYWTQFEDWKRFDEDHGYYTLNYLARIARTSDDLSDVDNALALNEAINEIAFFNIGGNYKKIFYHRD